MRVIAGVLGGRSLVAPRGQGTRPTSDRVREALFNVLGDVTGAVVLDLYAGTGALGIEALSRGATRAAFVESGRPALASLRSNLEALGLTASSAIVASPVLRAVRGLSSYGPFDLVLADPPYANLVEAVEALELAAAQCADRARIVLEHASRDAAPVPAGLIWQATRRYGDTSLSFYSVGTARDGDAAPGIDDLGQGACEDVSSDDADG